MLKPKITFDSYRKRWRCQTIVQWPGEKCFVTGVGTTIKGSYARWKVLQRLCDKRGPQ